MTRAGDLMTEDCLTLSPEDSLRQAASLMTARHVGGAPVLVGRRVVGVVSLTDILGFEADRPGVPTPHPELRDPYDGGEDEWLDDGEASDHPGRWFVEMWNDVGGDAVARMAATESPEWDALDEHTVSEVMSRGVLTVGPDVGLTGLARMMDRNRVHRLLVVEEGELLGIVTTSDLVRALARSPDAG